MAIQHENALQIHKFAHVSASDPGAVGAGKAWVDTSEGAPYKMWIRNTANTGWVPVGLGNTGYGVYAGHALRQMELDSNPPYDVPAGMIMALYTGESAWRPITTGEMRLMLGIYNVPDGDARNRAVHYGTQLASTISDFLTAARASFTAGTNISIVDGVISASTQAVITIDSTPTSGSANAVSSGGTYTALGTKVDKITGKGLSSEDYTTAEKTKLSGIATGATLNATDAQLRDRATHTGTQSASTISNFNSAVDARISATALNTVVIVTGAGTGAINGVYTQRTGLYNGAEYFTKEGLTTTKDADAIVRDAGSDLWQILNSSGGVAYRAAAWAEHPYQVGVWFGTSGGFIGAEPGPLVRQGGLGALRESFVPEDDLNGAKLFLHESTTFGTDYVELRAASNMTNTGSQVSWYDFPLYSVTPLGGMGNYDTQVTVCGATQEMIGKIIYANSNPINGGTEGTGIYGTNAGAALTKWDVVYLGASQTWLKADANGSGTYPARGIVTQTVGSGDPARIMVRGTARNNSWTWTPGGTLYMSTTAGALTQTAPATTGDKVQIVGFAITATTAYFDFNGLYTTV